MGVNKADNHFLDGLLDLIESKRMQGRWRISVEEVGERVGVDLVELYRRIYENPRSVPLSSAIDGFDQERVGVLVSLLEELGYRDAEERLYRAGLFVPVTVSSRLAERLVTTYARRLREHSADWDWIEHLLKRGRRYGEAARRYLQEALPIEPVAREVAERFAENEGLASPAVDTLESHLRMLRERHVLDYAALGAGFFEAVYRFAVKRGFVEPKERREYYEERRGAGSAGEGFSPGRGGPAGERIEWARRVLRVSPDADRRELRTAYRKAMLRYHPDVNPAGHAVATELNAAYSLLLAGI